MKDEGFLDIEGAGGGIGDGLWDIDDGMPIGMSDSRERPATIAYEVPERC